MSKGRIRIRFRGNFAVVSADGSDATPVGRKAIGVLALLAECDTMRRSRRWLEDKLWSDRGPDQARGSLRATLHEIRRSLGPAAALLQSDRADVWLDTGLVETDLADRAFDREFLEGLDINDPEFNDWLILKRLEYGHSTENAPPPRQGNGRQLSIQCGIPWIASSTKSTVSQVIEDQVGKIIRDFVALSQCTVGERAPDLIVRTSVETTGQGAAIFSQIIDASSDQIVHSDHCFTDDIGAFLMNQEAIGRFCWGIADVALERLPATGKGDSPAAMRARFVQLALSEVLTFEGSRMRNSLSVMDQAAEYLNSGLFHAVKAWALMSMIMEGFQIEDAAALEQIHGLVRRAEEASPGDAMVAAVAANVSAILFEDYGKASTLARRVLRENPNNLFALQALSVCRAQAGAFDLAYKLSNHSRVVSSLSKFEAMCNLHHALLCINLKRLAEATNAADKAGRLSASYRAPRRQLIALRTLKEGPEAAQCDIAALQSLEADFALERYLFDRSYPSHTLRNSGVLGVAVRRLGFGDEIDRQ